MDVITIDFETYYSKDYSLTKKSMTTQKYVDDVRFETIGVAVKIGDGEAVWFSGSDLQMEEFLAGFNFEDAAVLAHNALFDATILAWRYGIKPKVILDTLSMARAVHGVEAGGSLKALAERYQLGVKGDEVVNAMGKRRKDFSPEELARYGEYCKNDADLTYALFKEMAFKFNKVEIKLIDMTIRMHAQPCFELNIGVLEAHLKEVQAKKEALLIECAMDRKGLMSNPQLATLLEKFGVSPPMKISARTGKPTYAFAKSDEGFKALLEHEDERVQAIVAARLGVKSTLEETRTERFIKIWEAGGALPVPLKYYGALTGRWAAIDSINLQNLPRASKLKKAIVAPLGYNIVGADLSNIELRVGLYFAGQLDKVKMLGDGLDLYKDFAAKAFNVGYDEVDDAQRFVGKTSQLSLIYGTGAKKLRAQIKMLSGRDIGEEFAASVVALYREEYQNVKSAWYKGDTVIRAMRNNTEYTYEPNASLHLKVLGEQGIQLPSGMFISYPELSGSQEGASGGWVWTYKTRKGWVKIYGPKVFQNVVQALARCVMGEAMVRINKTYRVALTIHDALYCVVPEAEAEEARRYIITEMRKAPAWLPGIPLDAEGGYGDDLSFKMTKL